MGLATRLHETRHPDGPVKPDHEAVRRAAQLIADLMDTVIRVPGTEIRIGLDPLIGLIPGVGDAIAGAIGSTLLVLAHRLGVPRIVQVRMAMNVVLNAVVGAVPGLGDLFSVWFKSNVRNARLLQRHASTARQSTTSDWVFVVALIAAVLLSMGLALAGVVWLVQRLATVLG